MELTGAAEAARKVRDEKPERWWRKVTRRGSGSRTDIILEYFWNLENGIKI